MDTLPPIRTKLYRPRITADLVPRSLPLVSAPAGYGKTTLVCSRLETCECLSAWMSLDEGDDDLVLFRTYLLAAASALLKAVSLPPPTWRPAAGSGHRFGSGPRDAGTATPQAGRAKDG
jgi:hypothetical protein